jgi:hypothetical protein
VQGVCVCVCVCRRVHPPPHRTPSLAWLIRYRRASSNELAPPSRTLYSDAEEQAMAWSLSQRPQIP